MLEQWLNSDGQIHFSLPPWHGYYPFFAEDQESLSARIQQFTS